jgi:hypothetical protein
VPSFRYSRKPHVHHWLVIVDPAADHRAARTRHPDAVALDGGVWVAAAPVLLEEGVEVGDQVWDTLIAHMATLLGR